MSHGYSEGASGYSPGALVPLSLSEAAADLMDFVSREDTRFPLGWTLDDTCGQVGTGEMALVWARTGAGKSTWFLNVIANTPTIPTVVFNMEMTPRRQLEWLVAMSMELGTPSRDIEDVLRAGHEDPRYHEVYYALMQASSLFPHLSFVNPTSPTCEDLAVVVDDIEASTGTRPMRVFIDHLSLMNNARDYRGVSEVAAQLHDWAMKEDLALYVVQQTGRGGGDDGRNDGHLPVTLSSGLYAGEADADWIFGLYRPDRDPRFKRRREQFRGDDEKYFHMLNDRDKVRGLVIMQLIKNRPFGETKEDGIEFQYDSHTRRYAERGVV